MAKGRAEVKLLHAAPAVAALGLMVVFGAFHNSRTGAGQSPAEHHRRLGGTWRAELKLRMCPLPLAGSADLFEMRFPSSPEPHIYHLRPGALPVYIESIVLEGPPPFRVSLTSLSEDGLCIEGLSLDGVPAQGRFPVWLDHPCEGGSSTYGGTPCGHTFEWDLPTSTTTSTQTTTATSITSTTITSTTITSTTSTATTTTTTLTTTSTTATTTATSSTRTITTTTSSTTSTATTVTSTFSTTTSTTTTRTTTTTTIFVVRNYTPAVETAFTAFTTAVAPPVFFDVLYARLDIAMNKDSMESPILHDVEEHVTQAITRFLGLAPPSSMRCRLQQKSDSALAVNLKIQLPGSDDQDDEVEDLVVTPSKGVLPAGNDAEYVQELLTHPRHRHRLNKLLDLAEEEMVSSDKSRRLLHMGFPADEVILGGDQHNETFRMDSCRQGAMFCCVHAVVDSIVHNAGVIHAYRFYFLLALVLILAVGLVWFQAAGPCTSRRGIGSEKERGLLVMPLFAVAVTFQAALFGMKAIEKYMMLVEGCKGLPLGPCPPTKSVLTLELLFAGGLLLPFACFAAWWHRSWRQDCQAEKLQQRRRRHIVSPLESMLRRSDTCACYAVRSTDKNSKAEHVCVLVLNVLLSLAVTLTSFFLLQRYSFPTGLTAWFPYKIFYELFLASGIKFTFRIVVRQKLLGSFTFAFLCSSIALIGTLCIWLWITIMRTVFSLHSSLDAWRIVRLLDIAVGAGLVNCVLSSLSVSFAMYFFSIYVYEPKWRHKILRCVHLMSPEDQIGEVAAMVGAPEQDLAKSPRGHWEIKSVRTAAGEQVELPDWPAQEDVNDGDEEEASLCATTPASCSSSRSLHILNSLGDVVRALPNRSHPLIIDLRRTDAASCASRMVNILDYVLSVDSKLPVVRSSRECMDPRLDLDVGEDDFENSESEGSASESTDASGTETESSEDHPASRSHGLLAS